MAQRLWPQPADDILIETVAIDDESLRRWGQWPWPRILVADLVKRIAAGKPRVLGIDILFAEPDRLSPPLIAKSVPDLPGAAAEALARHAVEREAARRGDRRRADRARPVAERRAGRPPAAPHRGAAIRQSGGDVRRFLTVYPSMIRSLPEIRAAARAEAAVTDEPDEDGVVRAVPLLSAAAGQLVAGFAIEVIRVAPEIPVVEVTAGSGGIERVALGPLSAPTDAHGRALLHFARPRAALHLGSASARSGVRPEPVRRPHRAARGHRSRHSRREVDPARGDAGGRDPGAADRVDAARLAAAPAGRTWCGSSSVCCWRPGSR